MKKSGIFAASMAAASASAISASSSSSTPLSNTRIQISHEECVSRKHTENIPSQSQPSSDKFAPRFDGLRFIETLVTAHR